MNLEFNSVCRRNIPCSTEIHWRDQGYFYKSGRHARKTCWWLLERPLEQKLVRFAERVHEVHSIERKTSQGIYVVLVRLTKVQTTTRPDHVWPEVWTQMGKAAQTWEKQEWKNEKPKLDKLYNWGEFTLPILMTRIAKALSKLRGENWKDLWQQPCRAKGKLGLAPRRWLQMRNLHPKRFPKLFVVEKCH